MTESETHSTLIHLIIKALETGHCAEMVQFVMAWTSTLSPMVYIYVGT